MNTLTKNRILQKGDEYLARSNNWEPVPKEDWGLQILFTKYGEVRRPNEKPISPEQPGVESSKAAKAESEPVASPVVARGAGERSIQIGYPDPNGLTCIWTGRNGTFTARAINLSATSYGTINVVPVGKRGAARNAIIEFPASIIPQVVDWLLRHQTIK